MNSHTKHLIKLITISLIFFITVTAAFLLIRIFLAAPEDTPDMPSDWQSAETTGETSKEPPAENTSDTSENTDNIPTTAAPLKTPGEENCTLAWKKLMLINPIYTVSTAWIANRRSELVNITDLYGIKEGNAYNGAPLLDPEAASHLNDLVKAYEEAFKGHTLATRSCFRSVGTNCGRLCYATGTSDHHTGYTCDLVDEAYGGELNTDLIRPDWTWLHDNSYKYGFIDRFVPEWAGGSMAEPVNVDANGTTGLYETWHFRYVGLPAAEEIATGKYNGGRYDSLEHYLKASSKIKNLLTPNGCQ